jgi:hypothetical protein
VLVVIGLIIGAVLKGQDLINNARMKRFVNFVRNAEIAEWGYFDRNGEYAVSTRQLANMTDFRQQQTLTLGPGAFSVGIARTTDTSGKVHRALVVLPTTAATMGTALDLTKDNDRMIVEYFKSLAGAVDGSVGLAGGRVRGISAAVTLDANERNETIASSSLTDYSANFRTATSIYGAIYWFDTIPTY